RSPKSSLSVPPLLCMPWCLYIFSGSLPSEAEHFEKSLLFLSFSNTRPYNTVRRPGQSVPRSNPSLSPQSSNFFHCRFHLLCIALCRMADFGISDLLYRLRDLWPGNTAQFIGKGNAFLTFIFALPYGVKNAFRKLVWTCR